MRLLISVGICLGAAGVGSLITRPALPGWYARLTKPSWTPPNWLFGPVWTTLYLMMAVAAWLVWGKIGLTAWPMQVFAAQLLLNVAWSGLFFGLRSPRAAFAELILLWAAIVTTTIAFWGIAPIAGYLFVPYLFWTTYAAALNFSIWRLNQRLLPF